MSRGFRRVLLAYDGSEGSKRALERVAEIAAGGAAEVHVVAVGRVPEYAETEDEVDEAREQAEGFFGRRLQEAMASLRGCGLDAATHLSFGKPSEQIVRVADAIGADLIVLGVHPRHPLRRRVLGGTADKVVDTAECSVLVVR